LEKIPNFKLALEIVIKREKPMPKMVLIKIYNSKVYNTLKLEFNLKEVA